MTDDELKAIEARANAADAAPWLNSNATKYVGTGQIGADGSVYDFHGYSIPEANNREFIAHARQDIPALVAEVRRLRELLLKIASDGGQYDAESGVCLFCRELRTGHIHAVDCPAFMPDGELK